jgi:hypothetical protein
VPFPFTQSCNRAIRKKRPKPSLSSKQNLCRHQASQASDAVSDQDDFNVSEDEGSESDFEESDGKAFQLRLSQTNNSHYCIITFKAKTGMSSRGKLRSVRQTCSREFYKSQLTGPIPQRTRNEQTEVAERATTLMTPTGQRKRHQQSPSHRPSLQPMARARADAENAALWQSLYPASLSYSYFLFCIRTIVLPRPYEKGGRIHSTCLRKYSRVLDRTWHMRVYTSQAWNSFSAARG